jgi:hypothetical protein
LTLYLASASEAALFSETVHSGGDILLHCKVKREHAIKFGVTRLVVVQNGVSVAELPVTIYLDEIMQ